MPNKIKEIFSTDMFSISGHLNFINEEAQKKFMEALEVAFSEGRFVPVEGVTSISTEVKHQGSTFPLERHQNITYLGVGPAREQVDIPINAGREDGVMTFWRTSLKNAVVLETDPESIVFFKFTFSLSEGKHTVNYRVQFDKAKTVKDVAESFLAASSLLKKFYKQDIQSAEKGETVTIRDVTEYFQFHGSVFERLSIIENEFSLSISPQLLKDLSREEKQDIDELFLLLIMQKTIRVNGKLTSTESTSITVSGGNTNSAIGSSIELTFLGTIDFSFLGNTVRLYTANLLSNAIVKEIIEKDDGSLKILYGDTDSKPMFISFSAFKTKEEAHEERDAIMDHIEDYRSADISSVYIDEFYNF